MTPYTGWAYQWQAASLLMLDFSQWGVGQEDETVDSMADFDALWNME